MLRFVDVVVVHIVDLQNARVKQHKCNFKYPSPPAIFQRRNTTYATTLYICATDSGTRRPRGSICPPPPTASAALSALHAHTQFAPFANMKHCGSCAKATATRYCALTVPERRAHSFREFRNKSIFDCACARTRGERRSFRLSCNSTRNINGVFLLSAQYTPFERTVLSLIVQRFIIARYLTQ